MTELERQLRQQTDQTLQAYLGFVHGGMATIIDSGAEPTLYVTRDQTIEAFGRVHQASASACDFLRTQYAGGAPVVVRREWWRLVSGDV